jgi:hypothetical protein
MNPEEITNRVAVLGQPPPPAPEKGDLSKLWNLLGVHFNVNPKSRLGAIKKELTDLQKMQVEA